MKQLSIVFCALIGLAFNAYSQQNRVVIIEEFTSATCKPCVEADKVLAKVANTDDGIVVLKYHLNYPSKGDPFFERNPAQNQRRSDYYPGSSGLPKAYVNGRFEVDPRDSNAMRNMAAMLQNRPLPISLEVQQDISDIKNATATVKMTSAIPLDNYTLRAAVFADLVSLPDLPEKLGQFSNGQSEFKNAMIDMLPSEAGTPVTLKANEQKEITLNFQLQENEFYPSGKVHVLVFLQNEKTKEIVQTAWSKDVGKPFGSLARTTIAMGSNYEPLIGILDKNQRLDMDFTIRNSSTSAMTYSAISFAKSSGTPPDWNINAGNAPAGSCTLDPGAARVISLRLTRSAMAGAGKILFSITEQNGRTYSATPIIALASETEGIHVADNISIKNQPFADVVSARNQRVYIESDAETTLDYSDKLPLLKSIIWNCGDSGDVNQTEAVFLARAINEGKNIVLSGGRLTSTLNFGSGKFLFDTLGIRYGASLVRSATYTVDGIATDPISDGFSEQARLAGTLVYPIRLKTAAPHINAIPFLRIPKSDSILAVRVQRPTSRIVYFSFDPTAIENSTKRNALLSKALDWVEDFVFERQVSISSNVEDIDFGQTALGTEPQRSVEVLNTGNVPFPIDAVTVTGSDANDFSIVSGGLGTIEVGKKHTVTLKFTPKINKDYAATLTIQNIESGAKASVQLKGSGFVSGISEPWDSEQFRIVEHPVSQTLAIAIAPGIAPVEFRLYSLAGVEIFRKNAESPMFVESIAGLAPGTYIVVAKQGQRNMSVPIVVMGTP